jgi:hypothetical protein
MRHDGLSDGDIATVYTIGWATSTQHCAADGLIHISLVLSWPDSDCTTVPLSTPASWVSSTQHMGADG